MANENNDFISPFSIDKIAECFPFDSFRESQEEVLEDIITSFNNDVDVIMFRGDVGFGKSPIGICLGRMTDKKNLFADDDELESPFGAYYTTPQKILQDQLLRDFNEYINVIKGRSSYSCTVIPGNTCKDGMCQFDTKYECEEVCAYREARDAAANGQIACANLMYMIVVPKFLFGERQLLIVDEVHSISDWALNHVGCTLSQNDLGSTIPRYKTYAEYIKWLDNVYLKLSTKFIELDTRLQELELDDNSNNGFALGLKEARDAVGIVFGKVGLILKDYENTGEEWIWQFLDEGTRKEKIKFEPITAGRFLDDIIWWRGKKKLLMSGTIFPELFVEEAGLTDKVCEYREVPSIFPKENRPIYVWPVGKMTLYERENTIPKMIDRVAVINHKYPNDKGIVHCGTYDIAKDLYAGLVEILGEDKVSLQDRDNREGSLREWMESDEPVLFLSINMTEGLDLKDKLCRYQIIAKIQFGFLGDRRVKARMEMSKYTCDACGKSIRTIRDLKDTLCKCGEGKLFIDMDIHVNYCSECDKRLITGSGRLIESDICSCGNSFTKTVVTMDGRYWYDCSAIIDLIQSYGRAVRTPTDYSDFYILDSSFVPLYRKRYQTFPKMFKECVRVVKQ